MPRLDQWVMYTSIAVMFLTVLIPTAIGPDPTPKPVTSSPSSEPYAAIVLGSTGAVGRQLVRELASSYLCSRVGIVVRASQQWSAMEQSAKMIRKHFRLSPEQAEKITVISVPFEVLETESFMDVYRDKFKGYQKGFSAMGTTSVGTRRLARHRSEPVAELVHRLLSVFLLGWLKPAPPLPFVRSITTRPSPPSL